MKQQLSIRKWGLILVGLPFFASSLHAQTDDKKVTLHGSVQSDWVVPQTDDQIGTEKSDDAVLTNTYVDLMMQSRYVDAGARLEYLQHPLQGFEPGFKGWGVPHVYVKGKLDGADITLGHFYEQFGSGLILRTYQERSLGIDNSLLGLRVNLSKVPGLNVKAVAGTQRAYWDYDLHSWVYGLDAEADMSQYLPSLQQHGTSWTLGGSWVGKHDKEGVLVSGTNYALRTPCFVNAFHARTQVQQGDFGALAEYAWKDQDPSFDNGYTYHRGHVETLTLTYSKKGISAQASAKRSQDMSFRSLRDTSGASRFINNMQPFAYQHTYALAALYPYATQYGKNDGTTLIPGEWAFQGSFGYSLFPWNKTKQGKKYASHVKFNFSHIRGLDCEAVEKAFTTTDAEGHTMGGTTAGTDGYTTRYFGMSSEPFYQDINLQLDQKLGKSWKLNLMYMRQNYNQTVVEGHGGEIKSNVYVGEAKWTINKTFTLRGELQYLDVANGHESGDWVFGLLELSVLPKLMFTVSDMYGSPYLSGQYGKKQHYYMASATFTHKSHRLMVGYGRTRAGFNCSGGVCRWVPASYGVQASYNYSF